MQGITFSKAVEGYTLYAQARRLSPHTIADYANTFARFAASLGGDPPFVDIAADHVRRFLATQPVSKKTALNYHAGLSALWRWAVSEGYVSRNIVRDVTPPKPEERAVEPFVENDVKAMLSVLDQSRTYTRPGMGECNHTVVTGLRNRATASRPVDHPAAARHRHPRDGAVPVADSSVGHQEQKSPGLWQGGKERIVPFSPQTAQAIWKYLATRPEDLVNDYLFVAKTGEPLNRQDLCRLITRIGERAGVPDAHPHRFRHTFSINFLRNGGNVFTLQTILGHATMKMVRRYLALAQADVEAGHRLASPVANWRL
ncbi:MAG: tyrosine-type recombinase/integrase [Thermoflexales bacterium]|nr:tyrosine-type recombinase/integrase [Thermoflexales bacterium]